MNEGFRIHLVSDGQPVHISSFTADGIELNNETAAPPRGFTIVFSPGNPISEYRLRRVSQLRDWDPGEFHFRIGVDADALLCQGVDPRSLPSGAYRVQVMISDLTPLKAPLDFEVPDNRIVDLVLEFKSDPRQVELTKPVDEFDPQVKRVVQDSQSLLDGQTVPDWLNNADARPRRKACLLNLLAKLRAAAGPKPNSQLIEGVQSLFFGDVDRVYARVSSGFLANLQTLSADPSKPFHDEGTPSAAIHQQLLNHVPEQDRHQYRLLSFRQEGNPSMQAVVARPPVGGAGRNYYADLDIDLGNALQDVQGFVIHMGELLTPGKTDHLALATKLAQGPTAQFLYYRVTTPQHAVA